MISGFSNAMVIVRPFGCVRLKGGFALGVLCRLCRSRSLFRKSIFPPAGTTTTRGANTQSFWSIVTVAASAAAGGPAGGFSSQTTALRMPPCGERTSSSGFFSLPHTYWSIVTASFFSSGAVPFSVTVPLIAPPAASPGVARPVTMVMTRAHNIVDEARLWIEDVTAASFRASVYAIIAGPNDHVASEGSMVSRRVVRSYQARYSMGANKAAMYDLTDAIDVHAHARGHDEEEPLHAAQEASRAGMKAILFKSISPGRPWEVARKVQEDVDRWAERESLRPVKCLSAWVIGIPLKPIDFTEIKAAVEGGVLGMWMPPVTSAWSIYRLGGRGVWFDKARHYDDPVAPVAWDQALKTGMYVLDDHGRLLPAIRDTVRL